MVMISWQSSLISGDFHDVVVKNTFIEFREPPRPEDLNRAKSAPASVYDRGGETALEHTSPPSSKNSDAGDTGDTVHAPAPARKMSSDMLEPDDWLNVPALSSNSTEVPRRLHSEGGLASSSAAAPREQEQLLPTLKQELRPCFTRSIDLASPGADPALLSEEQLLLHDQLEEHRRNQSAPADLAHPALPQPQTLSMNHDGSGSYEVRWTVDARKLKGNDKQAVSPPFDLRFSDAHPAVTFKMMMYPADKTHAATDGKSGSTFKRAGGHGTIQLKCEGDLASSDASIAFALAIGSASKPKQPKRNGEHRFSQSAVCGLPKDGKEIWDFDSVKDSSSQTFYVYLTVQPRVA
jgi:hypothetical protein